MPNGGEQLPGWFVVYVAASLLVPPHRFEVWLPSRAKGHSGHTVEAETENTPLHSMHACTCMSKVYHSEKSSA